MNDYIDAIIKVKVPKWQIGQKVQIYFPDSMCTKGICEEGAETFTLLQVKELFDLNVKLIDEVENLKNERPQGNWKFRNDNSLIPTGYYECDRCEIGKELTKTNFCPYCGADMRGD